MPLRVGYLCYHPRPRLRSRGRDVNNKDILRVRMQVGFNWLLPQYTVRNQLPVIKPSASAIIRRDVYVHDWLLSRSRFKPWLVAAYIVVVVTRYAQDGFQRYPNNSHLCLGMIFDCCGTGK